MSVSLVMKKCISITNLRNLLPLQIWNYLFRLWWHQFHHLCARSLYIIHAWLHLWSNLSELRNTHDSLKWGTDKCEIPLINCQIPTFCGNFLTALIQDYDVPIWYLSSCQYCLRYLISKLVAKGGEKLPDNGGPIYGSSQYSSQAWFI